VRLPALSATSLLELWTISLQYAGVASTESGPQPRQPQTLPRRRRISRGSAETAVKLERQCKQFVITAIESLATGAVLRREREIFAHSAVFGAAEVNTMAYATDPIATQSEYSALAAMTIIFIGQHNKQVVDIDKFRRRICLIQERKGHKAFSGFHMVWVAMG
jgi:hypothetical protein